MSISTIDVNDIIKFDFYQDFLIRLESLNSF